MGARSSALSIQTDDVNIVIDPAVALAPIRFGLPPHPVENAAKKELWMRIEQAVETADVIVVTHYHYDHVEPEKPEIYAEKKVLVKHPLRMINPSQRKRAASFLKSIKGIVEEIHYADSKRYKFRGTEISFSEPVPHGSTAIRGYVIQVYVEAGDDFLYTSDVQGPLLNEQLEFVLEKTPDVLFVDGPSTYIDSPYQPIELRKANENLTRILTETDLERLVVDHHLTRDLDYREQIKPVFKVGGELGVPVMVAAEFLEIEPNLLEARRKELYGKVRDGVGG